MFPVTAPKVACKEELERKVYQYPSSGIFSKIHWKLCPTTWKASRESLYVPIQGPTQGPEGPTQCSGNKTVFALHWQLSRWVEMIMNLYYFSYDFTSLYDNGEPGELLCSKIRDETTQWLYDQPLLLCEWVKFIF